MQAVVLECGHAPGRGYAGGQQPLDMIDDRARFHTAGKFASAGAFPAGAFDQIADFKVETITGNWHWFCRKKNRFVLAKDRRRAAPVSAATPAGKMARL
jgi:hypothetical protein